MRIWVLAVFLLAVACAAERTLVFRAADRTPAGEPTMVQIRGARADIAEIKCYSHSIRGDTLRMFCTPRAENVELDDISIVRDGETHRIFYSAAHTVPDDGRAVERIEAFHDPGLASSDFWKVALLMGVMGILQLLVVLTFGPYTNGMICLAAMGMSYICRDAVQYIKRSFQPAPPEQQLSCLCYASSSPIPSAIGDECKVPEECEDYVLQAHEEHKKERLTYLLTEIGRLTHATEEEIQRARNEIAARDTIQVLSMCLMFAEKAIRARIE